MSRRPTTGSAVPEAVDDLPTGDEKAAAVEAMFDAISDRYDLLNRILTFGLDIRWRRRAVSDMALPPGSRVLDVACGTGDFCRELHRGGHHPVGLDVSAGMLAAARAGAPLVRADALVLPMADGQLDGVTCGFAFRNFVDLGAALAEMARVTRPGGRLAALEVATPANPVLRGGHAFYFGRVVPLVGGVLSDRRAYRYLPRSTTYLPGADGLRDLLGETGWADAERHLLGGGAAQLLTATRR